MIRFSSPSSLESDQDANVHWWCIDYNQRSTKRLRAGIPSDPRSLLTIMSNSSSNRESITVNITRTIPFFLVDMERTTLTGVGQELPARPGSALTLCDAQTRCPLFDFAAPGTRTHRHTPDPKPSLAVVHYRRHTFVWLLGSDPIGVKRDHLKKLRQRFQSDATPHPPPESVVAGATKVLRALVSQICPTVRLPSRLTPMHPAVVRNVAAFLSEKSKKAAVRSAAAKCAQTVNTICDCITSDTSLRRSTEETLVQLMCDPSSCFATHVGPEIVVNPGEVHAALRDQHLDMSDLNATTMEKTLLQLYEAFLVLAVAAGADHIVADYARDMVDADDSFLGLHHRTIHAVTRASRGIPKGTTRRMLFRRIVGDPKPCGEFLDALVAYVQKRVVAATDMRRRLREIKTTHDINFVVSHGRGTLPNHMRLFVPEELRARMMPLQWIWLMWRETLRQHARDMLTVPTFIDLMFRDHTGIAMVRAYVGWHAVVSRRLATAERVPSGIVQVRRSEKSSCNLFGPPLRLAIAALWAYVETEFPNPESLREDERVRRAVCARLTSIAAAWCLQVWFGFRPHILEEIQICTVPEFEALEPRRTHGVDLQFGLFVVYDRYPDPQTLRVHIHDTKPVISGNMGNGKRRRLTTDSRYRPVIPVREAGIWSETAPEGLRRVLLRLIPAYVELTRPTPDRSFVPDLRPDESGQFPRVHIHTLPWPTTSRAYLSRNFVRPDAVDQAPPEARASIPLLRTWIEGEIKSKRKRRADFFVDQPPHHRTFWRTGSHPKRLASGTVRVVTEVLRQFLACDRTVRFYIGTKQSVLRGSLGIYRVLTDKKKRGGDTYWLGGSELGQIRGNAHIFKKNHRIDDVDINTLRIIRTHHAQLNLGFDRAGRHSTMARLLGVSRFLRTPLMRGTVQESYATRVRELLEAEMASTMRREAHLSMKIVVQHYDKLATADPFVDLAQHLEHIDRRLESYPEERWPDYLVDTPPPPSDGTGLATSTLARADAAANLDFLEQMRQLLWFDTLRQLCQFTETHRTDFESCPHPPQTLLDFVTKKVLARYTVSH